MTAPSWRMSWMLLQGQLMRGRKARGLTQADVAERLGVSKASFVRWEHGKAEPNMTQLFRWADLCGVQITSSVRVEVVSRDNSEAA